MIDAPVLSFIVLSCNYEDFIKVALRSILEQSTQAFEIVVVDDASSDESREVIRGFQDPRIRLLVNDRNMGGAWSYNRAVQAARGHFLVNLDADDWSAPERCERQLAEFSRRPELDILGTHVVFVDGDGKRHPRAPELEAFTNGSHDLNRIDTWVGANHLCRSSTMIRRSAHLRVGLDDTDMVRAPDYELWTRALRLGCRFGVVAEQLTYYRLQNRGVTHADPRGTLLELSYAMLCNLLPMIEDRAAYVLSTRMLDWVTGAEAFAGLRPIERYRLVGMLLTSPQLRDFRHFTALLASPNDDPAITTAGRRFLAHASISERAPITQVAPQADPDPLREHHLAAERELSGDRDRWRERCLARERELAKSWARRTASRLLYAASNLRSSNRP